MAILVIAEHDNKQLKTGTTNTIAAATKLGADVSVLVAGHQCADAAAAAAKVPGVTNGAPGFGGCCSNFQDSKYTTNAPYLVLNHGRPASEADFAQMKRQRFSALSRYFVGLGFTVLVPTRVGYGDTGGPDVEHSGRCDSRNYPPVYAAAADETEQLLGALARHPGVSLERGLVVGQSFGGLTTLALSARRLPGLVAGVNFAGGGGGNPSEHPGNPCSAGRLARLFRQYGEQAQVPTLWFYSENDRFWGAQLPKDWAAGYNEAGGRASFVSLPPYKADGHGSFAGQPEAWKPAFEQFLKAQGFAWPATPSASPHAVSAGSISVAICPGATRAAWMASAPSAATVFEVGDVFTQCEFDETIRVPEFQILIVSTPA